MIPRSLRIVLNPFAKLSCNTIDCGWPAQTVSRMRRGPPSVTIMFCGIRAILSNFRWQLLWSRRKTTVCECGCVLEAGIVTGCRHLFHELLSRPIPFPLTAVQECHSCRLDNGWVVCFVEPKLVFSEGKIAIMLDHKVGHPSHCSPLSSGEEVVSPLPPTSTPARTAISIKLCTGNCLHVGQCLTSVQNGASDSTI